MDYRHAVVVIPAHDEAHHLPECLKAMVTAAACAPVPVLVVVVLDACTDGSAELAGRFGADVHFVEVDARSVGASRAAGFEYARRHCAEQSLPDECIWYATTDADTRVDADWLTRQLDSDADVLLGVVRIGANARLPMAAVRRYLSAYRAKRRPDGHGHVHGANMGFSASAYWAVGGFAPLRAHEDVDLVRRFESAGCHIARDDTLSVLTSARESGRAPMGFSTHLASLTPRAHRDTA